MAQEVIEITEREIEIIEVIERGPVGPTGPQPNINYEVVSNARTLEAADLIAADTSGGAFTLTLPANPNNGDAVDIFDFSETFDTNPLTIARNGQPIESLNEDLVANVEGAYFTLIYTGSTRGWQVLPRYGTSGGGGESALTTQGDMLYRGVGINTRLPIGSAGQILKVNSGATAPEWGAAPATGVTSVGIAGSDGIEVDSGSPVTGSGSIALGVNAATLRSHINVADGANNYTHPNHSGEVTSSGDGATTIANDVVTNAKLANVATATIKGRATAGTGDPEDLTASQVRTILNVADGAEVNVQSNWTEADSGSDAFILNKPSIPTASSTTPSALGVAAAGTSSDFARANHVHAMPSAADVGAAPASGIEPTAITGTAVVDSDARLSDSRTPTAHAASHASAGSDPLAPSDIGAADASHTHSFYGDIQNAILEDPSTCINDIFGSTDEPFNASGKVFGLDESNNSVRYAVSDFAEDSHSHGNITNDGKVGSTAGLPLKTGTAGAVEAGAFGTSAGEFAEGNHTHAQLHDKSHTMTDATSHTAGNHKVFYSNGSGEIVELALGNSGEVLTSNGATSAPSFAAASGGGVTTGSVDNAILRADGTGGSTSQSSDINIEDATTSTQNNVTISNQHSGQTNSALVLAPKGNGPLLGQKPNGAASGGNSRGNFSTDFQRERAVNTRVASGNYSVICGGFNNSATNQYAVVGSGDGNQATGARSAIVTGDGNTASGERSFIGAGNGCTASGAYSAILSGNAAVADRASLHVHAIGRFGGVNGSAQRIHGIYFGTTTTNSAVTIVNLSVPASKVIAAIINIVGTKSDGSATAHFVRQYSVKNSGGTTSEVYAAQTIGTDSAASTSVTLSASDANDQLVVECTGIVSETWRWVASVDAVEVSWAT